MKERWASFFVCMRFKRAPRADARRRPVPPLLTARVSVRPDTPVRTLVKGPQQLSTCAAWPSTHPPLRSASIFPIRCGSAQPGATGGGRCAEARRTRYRHGTRRGQSGARRGHSGARRCWSALLTARTVDAPSVQQKIVAVELPPPPKRDDVADVRDAVFVALLVAPVASSSSTTACACKMSICSWRTGDRQISEAPIRPITTTCRAHDERERACGGEPVRPRRCDGERDLPRRTAPAATRRACASRWRGATDHGYVEMWCKGGTSSSRGTRGTCGEASVELDLTTLLIATPDWQTHVSGYVYDRIAGARCRLDVNSRDGAGPRQRGHDRRVVRRLLPAAQGAARRVRAAATSARRPTRRRAAGDGRRLRHEGPSTRTWAYSLFNTSRATLASATGPAGCRRRNTRASPVATTAPSKGGCSAERRRPRRHPRRRPLLRRPRLPRPPSRRT